MLFKNLKAHASVHVLATFAVCALFPVSAFAQSGNAPVFTPVSSWIVGSTELGNVRGLNKVKLPCVVSNEYDNGFVVRFSGGGGQMLAMAIDFRQDVFKQGRKYDAMISIGDSYVKQATASAFTTSTLIFNLRPLGDFYNAVKNGRDMEINVEGNGLKFSLSKIAAAYPSLESCYAGEKTAPVKPLVNETKAASIDARVAPAAVPAVEAAPVAEMPPQQILPPAIAAQSMPESFDDIVKNADEAGDKKMKVSQITPAPRGPDEGAAKAIPLTPVPEAKTPVSPATPREPKVSRAVDVAEGKNVYPAAPVNAPVVQTSATVVAPLPPVAAPVAASFDAKAGEDMKIVLSRWAERAGYDLQWQANQDGKVAQDISFKGSFEDAVTQLLAENSAATGIAAHIEGAQGNKKDLSSRAGKVSSPSAQAAPVQATIPAFHSDWSAPEGANIQAILDQWGAKAGVKVIWQSYAGVAVKKAVNMTGSFESAVQTLLDQYADDAQRPVGQLNIDPDTGQRTLLMDMDK